jgi:hypothetical protein
MHYLGFTYSDARDLPIPVRRWYINRIEKQLKNSSDAGSTDSRSHEANTPEVRAFRGKSRTQVPARLRHAP